MRNNNTKRIYLGPITFFVEKQKAREEIKAHSAEVTKNLENRFSHLVLNVIVSERKIARFDSEDLLDKKAAALQYEIGRGYDVTVDVLRSMFYSNRSFCVIMRNNKKITGVFRRKDFDIFQRIT